MFYWTCKKVPEYFILLLIFEIFCLILRIISIQSIIFLLSNKFAEKINHNSKKLWSTKFKNNLLLLICFFLLVLYKTSFPYQDIKQGRMGKTLVIRIRHALGLDIRHKHWF